VIYAATAAALFLAKMQDAAPDFSQHVFAISGVSGGAIGATVFEALAQSAAGSLAQGGSAAVGGSQTSGLAPAAACASGSGHQSAAKQPLPKQVSQIMLDDHFSPVVGPIFPELLGATTGRAEALVGSFKNSVCSRDAVAGRALASSFTGHWSPTSLAPALVLNSTWVETGFRVAFAPFPLHGTDE